MNFSSLNDYYSLYTDKKITKGELEGYIFKHYLKKQDNTCICNWSAHEYEDFISWLFPRIRKAIDNYIDTGSSFEAYIYKIFLVASKEYKTRKVVRSVAEYSTWGARIPDLYVHEDPPEYSAGKNKSKNKTTGIIRDKKGRKYSKRILALLLKCYNYVSDDFLEKAAPMIEIEESELRLLMDKMRKLRQKKDDEIYLMRERMYCQFYRCIVYEKKLTLLKGDTTAYEGMKRKLLRARKRLDLLRKKLKITKKDATNGEIAEVIGISKGTVDACLYKLKEKYSLATSQI